MDSYGLPIGDRWTVNRRGLDPGNRICRRPRMETVERYFAQAGMSRLPTKRFFALPEWSWRGGSYEPRRIVIDEPTLSCSHKETASFYDLKGS